MHPSSVRRRSSHDRSQTTRPIATMAPPFHPNLASRALALSVLIFALLHGHFTTLAFVPAITKTKFPTSSLFAKKRKGNTPRPNPNYSKSSQPQQEKASVREARFDAATRQFMFTLVGLTKTLPDKSKDILKNIHLSFYPGAKIGVVGLNGSGKVRDAWFFFSFPRQRTD